MSGIEAIFGLVGGIVSAMGAIQQGKAEAAAAEFNAKAAEQQAQAEREAAAAEASDFRRLEGRKVAMARAGRGATGVTMAGSPLLVDEATVREVAVGAARVSHAGAVRSNSLLNESDLYKMRADNARKASYFAAGTSLLGSLGGIFG